MADQTRLVQLELAMAAQSPHVGKREDREPLDELKLSLDIEYHLRLIILGTQNDLS